MRQLKNDNGEVVKQALPGESVFVNGFRAEVDIGSAFYTVKDPNEAKHIVRSRVQRACESTAMSRNNFVSKKIARLTRREKKSLYAGDTSVLLALLEGDRTYFEEDARRLEQRHGKRFN